MPFAHGRTYRIGNLSLFDSYHCAGYNPDTAG
jgi:hypothetical protein